MKVIATSRTLMNRREVTAWLLRVMDFAPTYYLGSVAVHVVTRSHWLARHADELPSDVVVWRGAAEDQDAAWTAIDAYDTRVGRPPRMMVVVVAG